MATAVYKGKTANKKRPMRRKRSSWLARNFVTLVLTIIFVMGAGLLLYPSFANWWNSTRQSRVLEQYMSEIESVDTTVSQEQMAKALDYNGSIVSRGIMWSPSEADMIAYEEQLNAGAKGVMGFIEINSIDVKLPIYHGVDEATLTQGIGHIAGTSLPVGAKSFDDETATVKDPEDGAHSVISGHRGLPSSRLFTDLDRLQIGDTFALNIFNNLLIYEVDQIRIVEPSDLSALQLVKGEDYCTMVTCTPYGINTHRLLVRGRRVSTQDAERYIYRIQSNANQIKPAIVAPVMAAPVLFAMFMVVMLDPRRRRRRKAEKTMLKYGIEADMADLPTEILDLDEIDMRAILKATKGKRR